MISLHKRRGEHKKLTGFNDDNPKSSSDGRTQTSGISLFSVRPGDRIAGRYEVLEGLGVGAMGEVVKARDEHLDVIVAIKVLRRDIGANDTALQRFRQELLTARKVSHPNVVRLHDMTSDGERWILSMDYVSGESLQQKMEREGPLSPEAATDIAMQIAAGLAAAHDAGVVHRDLKPANILIDDSGRVLICDFGIARSLSHAGLTREGMIVGTPDYLSPEQAAGETVDARSDLYALGLILSEMLVGNLPFQTATTQESIAQRIAHSPEPLRDAPNIPESLRSVCHRLLKRNPEHRFQSAREIVQILGGDPEAQSPTERRSGGWLWVPVLLVIAGLIAWKAWDIDGPDLTDGTAATPTISRAILIANQGDESDAYLAQTGAVLDYLAATNADGLVGLARLETMIKLLSFDAEDAVTYPQRLLKTLEINQIVVGSEGGISVISDAGVSIAIPNINVTNPSDLAGIAATLSSELGLPRPIRASDTQSESARESTDFYRGLVALQQGNAMDAVGYLQRATAQIPEFAGAWWALGWAYALAGSYDESEDAYLQAGGLARGSSHYDQLAKISMALSTGSFEQADRAMDQLLNLRPGDDLVLLFGAEYFGDAGDFDRANSILDQLLDRFPENARAWFLKAKFAILQGDSQLALDRYLVQAETLHNRLRNRQGKADTINAQGIAYEQLGVFDQADVMFKQAATLRAEIGDARGEAATQRNLAALASYRGETELAQEHFDRAQSLLEQINDLVGLADLYNDAGVLAEERGEYESAYQAYRQSLDIRRRLNNQRSVAESLNNVGYVSFEQGAYERSRAYLLQALEQYQLIDDKSGRVHAQQNLAMLDIATGSLQQAEERLRSVVAIAEPLQMSPELAVNKILEAEQAFSSGEYQAALDAVALAHDEFQDLSDARGRLQSRLLESRIYMALGDNEKAKSLLDFGPDDVLNRAQDAERSVLLARARLQAGEIMQIDEALAVEDVAGARAALELAVLRQLAKDPSDMQAFADLAEQAAKLGHRDLNIETAMLWAQAALQQGKRDVAKDALASALSLINDDPSYLAPKLLHLATELCPIGENSCEYLQSQRSEAWERSQQARPLVYREQTMSFTGRDLWNP